MVGAGNLIKLLFGIPYETAVVIVGVVMMAYVLFGGMLATTWVQIVKAVLLLGGAFLLAVLVLARFGGNPLALFAAAADQFGGQVLGAGAARVQPARRHLARPRADVRHRRPAAHPDALLHGARRAHRAHVGVLRHRAHRRLLPADVHPRLRRDGARGPGRHQGDRQGRQHGGAAAGRVGRRHGLPRLHRRGGVRHHPRRRRRADALRRGGAVARPLGQRGARGQGARARSSSWWRASRPLLGGVASVGARHRLQGPERGVHGRRSPSPSRRAPTSRRWCSRSSGAASRPAAPRPA